MKKSLYTEEDEERFGQETRTQELPAEEYRTPWRRDYARVIHSPAFRRLQGKTQLFPGFESDYFRNRLTHSLEVAQIAKSIATRICSDQVDDSGVFAEGKPTLPEIVEVAGLAHDLGHPPFGHNGEDALDYCLKQVGGCGFEGNAQTFRTLTKLEKRFKASPGPSGISRTGEDRRLGLNLTYRTLASVLKYDHELNPNQNRSEPFAKGYYPFEASLCVTIKDRVTGDTGFAGTFKTLECYIMDLADDIAYSTYDLEDALKTGFIKPVNLLTCTEEIAHQISKKVVGTLGGHFNSDRVRETLANFYSFFRFEDEFKRHYDMQLDPSSDRYLAFAASALNSVEEEMARDGYLRSGAMSGWVGTLIRGVEVDFNSDCPALSRVTLQRELWETVEVLKHFTYEYVINSPLLRFPEHRGKDIIKEIFEALTENRDGYSLMPYDNQRLYHEFKGDPVAQYQVVADFIAGMTDRYALEFYGRLTSESPQTIFKPL